MPSILLQPPPLPPSLLPSNDSFFSRVCVLPHSEPVNNVQSASSRHLSNTQKKKKKMAPPMQPEDKHQELQCTQYVYVRQYTYVRYGANPPYDDTKLVIAIISM